MAVAAALNDETIEFHSFLLLLGQPRKRALGAIVKSYPFTDGVHSADVNTSFKGY